MNEFYDLKDYENEYQINKLGEIKSKIRNGTRNKEIIIKPKIKFGYLTIGLRKNGKQKFYRIHRLLALQFIPNPNNYDFVDHFDRNPLNNNLENLRWITHSGNMRNRDMKKNKNCSSKYKGVSWCKSDKRWRAIICIGGKNKYLGEFKSEEEAYECYKKKYDELMSVF